MQTKQEKLAEREQILVRAACDRIIEDGFFDLRMSDVAAAAKVSVGTLYVHFESREDLIVGCALQTLRCQVDIFQQVAESLDLDLIDKVCGFLMADYLFSKRVGELKSMEKLIMLPSIWKRASPQKMREINEVCDMICSNIDSVFEQAIEQNLFTSTLPEHHQNPTATSDSINTVIWGVSMGLHSVFTSFVVSEGKAFQSTNELSTYLEAVNALFTGFKCPRSYSQEDFSLLVSKIKNIVDAHDFFAINQFPSHNTN